MAIKVVRAKKTNIITLGDNVVEIISVQGKAANQTFFTSIQSYSYTGNQIIAKKVYDEIKVQYEDGVKTEFQKGLEKDLLNGQVSLFGGSINISKVTEAGTTAQTQRNSVEVSKNGSVIGLNIGGLLSLAENAQERVTTTDEPVVSILTNTVQNVNLSETSSSKTDITTLTGKETQDGFLNATITTGSPNGLNNALIAANVPEERRRDALKEASTEPATVESVTISTTGNPLESIIKGFTKQRDTTIRSQNNALGNPLGSFKLGNLGGFGSGPIGIPGTNMLGSLIGKLLGVSIPSVPNVATPSLPSGITVPAGITPPPNIIESTGQTNISKLITKPNVISSSVTNTVEPRNISKDTKFQGSISTRTGSTYKFDTIGGPEELQFEFRNVTRPITTMVVHWSRTYTDLDWGAMEIGREVHTKTQILNKPTNMSAEEYLTRLGVDGGLQFHYVIRRDGTIEIGRPINLVAPTLTGFGKYAVHVGFVGGVNAPSGTENPLKYLSVDSLTPDQWNSFDEIVKAFDMAKNGAGEFVGFNQFTRYGLPGPGFDVQQYVASKFGKATVYTINDFKKTEALSPSEIVSRKPQKPPVVSTPPNNPEPTTPVVTVDPTVPEQSEIDSRNQEYNAAVQKRDRLATDVDSFIDEFEKLEADPNVSETTLSAKEEEYYDLYDEHRLAVREVQRLKVNFINDDYLFVDKENKWIHGSQYNEYF